MADVLLTDIDGTLVDSNTLHAEAWRWTFEHFGIEIGMDDAWRQIGKGGRQWTSVQSIRSSSGFDRMWTDIWQEGKPVRGV